MATVEEFMGSPLVTWVSCEVYVILCTILLLVHDHLHDLALSNTVPYSFGVKLYVHANSRLILNEL